MANIAAHFTPALTCLSGEGYSSSEYKKRNTWNCPPQKIQLSRDDDVILRALISYQIIPQAAHQAVTRQVKKWKEKSARHVYCHIANYRHRLYSRRLPELAAKLTCISAATSSPCSANSPADDFSESAERRESINDYLCQYMRARAALWGVQINWVSIRDIELAPHDLAMININPINQC